MLPPELGRRVVPACHRFNVRSIADVLACAQLTAPVLQHDSPVAADVLLPDPGMRVVPALPACDRLHMNTSADVLLACAQLTAPVLQHDLPVAVVLPPDP